MDVLEFLCDATFSDIDDALNRLYAAGFTDDEIIACAQQLGAGATTPRGAVRAILLFIDIF